MVQQASAMVVAEQAQWLLKIVKHSYLTNIFKDV
jgi:hypothetical protein